jgi:hypothetical protein
MSRPRLSPGTINALLALGVFVVSLVALVLVSRLTPLATHEQRYVAAAKSLGLWFDRFGAEGSEIFGQRVRDTALSPVHAFAQLPAFVSGLVWQVGAHRHTWLQSSMGLRSGLLLFNALGVLLLFMLVQQVWGRRAGLFACALFLLIPRSLHLLATASGEGAAVTAWLLLGVAYLRSLRGGSMGWTLATGFALGLGLALSTSVLWFAAVLIAHTLWAKRSELRAAGRQGTIPVPSALLAAIVIAPAVFLVCSPWLWHETGVRLRQLFTTSLAPSVSPTYYGGLLIHAPPFPKSFGLRSVLLSLPTVTVVLTGAGAAVVARRWWLGRSDAAQQDRVSLGALIAIALVFVIGWPAISPEVLAVFPPRWILALPWIGALAGLGLDTVVTLTRELLEGRKVWFRRLVLGGGLVLVLGVPLLESVRGPSTLGAAFSPLSGGPSSVFASRTLPVHDASMVAKLAPAIDDQGRANASIWAPDVNAEVWEGMRSNGLLKTVLRAANNPREADYVLVSGGAGGDAVVRGLWGRTNSVPWLLGVVDRDGAILLALYRVK